MGEKLYEDLQEYNHGVRNIRTHTRENCTGKSTKREVKNPPNILARQAMVI
jgi:hypothetical protein